METSTKTLHQEIYEGISRAAAAAFHEEWYQAAPSAFEEAFQNKETIMASDVWTVLESKGVNTSNHRSAMGALFLRAEKAGLISRVGIGYRTTNDKKGHSLSILWKRGGNSGPDAVADKAKAGVLV
jgi:hypothetical protein